MLHPFATFCFAELHTADVEASARFYGELFGWTAVPVPASPTGADGPTGRLDHGGSASQDLPYFTFQLNGEDVIAMRRTSVPQRVLGYVNVEDVDAVAARAQTVGGRVEVPPFDTPGVARTAVLADREGARFGLWESRGHRGAGVQDKAGTMWWIELLSLDVGGARDFYTSLFGWDVVLTTKYADPGDTGEGLTVFKTGDTSVGSVFQAHPDWGVPPRWSVFFAIDDWKETVRRATRLGGELGFWRDVPNAGRLGVIEDPAGAAFIVMRPLAP